MQVQAINKNSNNIAKIKLNFKLSKETIKNIETSTGLTYEEMTHLPIYEAAKLIEQRGTLKKTSKIKLWLADKYRKINERLGL